MRMRKKKWAEPYLEAHPELVLADPSVYKGKWKELLQCDVLHVEIGMGKGGYIAAMAEQYPEEGWIGIERDRSAAAVAARHIIDQGISRQHLKLIAIEAENMEEYINGTDNSSQDDETDEQQSFFAPALTDNALNY